MKSIHLLHGCAPSWRSNEQTVRNYVSEEALKRYLGARSDRYGTLSDTCDRVALTIDDSTIGAERACVVVRNAGHDVTLFVNPAQVARGRPYWFSRLDAILDACKLEWIVFEGAEFHLAPGQPLRTFRKAVKTRLMALPEHQTDELLDSLAVRLEAVRATVPEHAGTLTLEALRKLVDEGVTIGSHGWDHRDITGMSVEEIRDDLKRAQSWFQRCLGLRPAHYAVPYGLGGLGPWGAREVKGMILLADPTLQVGAAGDNLWNRRDITSYVQGRFG